MSLILDRCNSALISPVNSCWKFNVGSFNECDGLLDSRVGLVYGVLAVTCAVESIEGSDEFSVKHVGVFVQLQLVRFILLVVTSVVLGDLVTVVQVDLVTETFLTGIGILLVMLGLKCVRIVQVLAKGAENVSCSLVWFRHNKVPSHQKSRSRVISYQN